MLIRTAIEHGDDQHLAQITGIIQRTGAIEDTKEQALRASQAAVDALAPLPESLQKQALIDLALLAVGRSS